MRFDNNQIEEIKNRIDIVDFVSEYLTLKKAGRNYVGLCPFHQEKTPSFTVNREKQIFYCFGCGEGGNVITFLMKITDKSFPEAIKDLADRAGVVLPVIASTEVRKKDSLKEGIINVNVKAAQYFARNLFSAAGASARRYLQERGIVENTVKTFNIGYIPDGWRSLADFLDKSGVSLKLAEQAGLVVADKGGGFYDRFRNRLMFPIENVSGDVVAFGGRILGQGEPKYLNSPESPVYIKGRNLYGLNRTKEDIRSKGYAIIVEGYFDLISLWNAGMGNVVATLGTALTKDHLDLLRRYTRDVVALFDPDEAGRKALDRSLELFLSTEMRARALVLPGRHDPDEYVRRYGREKLEELIEKSPSLVDYYIDHVLGSGKTFEDKRDIVKNAMAFLSKILDRKEKDLFIKRVAEKTGIEEGLLFKESYPPREEKQHFGKGVPLNVDSDLVEMHLIQMMLEYPQKITQVEETGVIDYFLQPQLQNLARRIIEEYKLLGFVDLGVLLASDSHFALRKKIFQLMMEALPSDEKVLGKIFADNVRQIRKRWFKEQHRQIKLKLSQAQESGNEEMIKMLLREKETILKQEKESR